MEQLNFWGHLVRTSARPVHGRERWQNVSQEGSSRGKAPQMYRTTCSPPEPRTAKIAIWVNCALFEHFVAPSNGPGRSQLFPEAWTPQWNLRFIFGKSDGWWSTTFSHRGGAYVDPAARLVCVHLVPGVSSRGTMRPVTSLQCACVIQRRNSWVDLLRASCCIAQASLPS